MLDTGVPVHRAIAISRGEIAAVEGICDRALKRLEASLAGIAERHRHHSKAVSHPTKKISSGAPPLCPELQSTLGNS